MRRSRVARWPAGVTARVASHALIGTCLPLGNDRLGLLVGDHVAGLEIRRLPHDDAVHGRVRLQPRRGVDDVAGHHRLAEGRARVERDHRLAGVDRDPDLQVAGHGADGVAHDERRPHRSLGVVAVGDGGSEHAHDRVADELLDDAAERLDLPADELVIWDQDRANVFGVELLGLRGRADEVDEDDRDDPTLFLGRALLHERRAARQAEPCAGRVLLVAGLAAHPLEGYVRTRDESSTVDA